MESQRNTRTKKGNQMTATMQLHHDYFQNHRRYNVPKAQLIIADIPYNVGNNAYGSNPQWYIDGDLNKGTSDLAGQQFFHTDSDFRIPEFMHFAQRLLKKEPKQTGDAGAMIIFCAFEQQHDLIQQAQKYGFKHYIPITFHKKYSPQVLKANMRIVGNQEYALVLYRDKLPKFRNQGRMIFSAQPWMEDRHTPKVHPTQKPVPLLEHLIETFTDLGDVVVDPTAGSGTTLVAAANLGRKAYGFEIDPSLIEKFETTIAPTMQPALDLSVPVSSYEAQTLEVSA